MTLRLLRVQPSMVCGDAQVPGDKSISHRLLLFAALADGVSHLRGLLDTGDGAATIAVLKGLGVEIQRRSDGTVVVVGGGHKSLVEPSAVLDCGRSGTTMRLCAGLLAGQPFTSTLSGDAQLLGRPMRRVLAPLAAMGASVLGRSGDGAAPFSIRGGALVGRSYHSPVASAQVKSALLLAGLFADGVTEVIEPAASRDHSERILAALGAPIERAGLTVRSQRLTSSWPAIAGDVPGDPSSAAFLLAAAALRPGNDVVVRDVALNPGRTAFLDVLRAAGATVEVVTTRTLCGEPIGDIAVRGAILRGFDVRGAMVPALIDEIPVLAVVAAFADGPSVFADAAELRVKETDRVATTVDGLRRLGGDAEARPDGLVVAGGGLAGGRARSHGDHRLAMAMAVAGTAARGAVEVEDAACFADSFPGFDTTFAALGVDIAWIAASAEDSPC